MITPSEVKKLREGATQGEWTVGFTEDDDRDVFNDIGQLVAACDDEDAPLIAAAPQMAELIEWQDKEIERLNTIIDNMTAENDEREDLIG